MRVMCSRILTVFVLVWAPCDVGLHRRDRQCAHAWAFQAVPRMAMLSEDGAISWKPGGLLLVPFAVVSCARARAGFIRPCECATQGGWLLFCVGPSSPTGGPLPGNPSRGACVVRDMRAIHAAQKEGPSQEAPFRRPCKTALPVGCHCHKEAEPGLPHQGPFCRCRGWDCWGSMQAVHHMAMGNMGQTHRAHIQRQLIARRPQM